MYTRTPTLDDLAWRVVYICHPPHRPIHTDVLPSHPHTHIYRTPLLSTRSPRGQCPRLVRNSWSSYRADVARHNPRRPPRGMIGNATGGGFTAGAAGVFGAYETPVVRSVGGRGHIALRNVDLGHALRLYNARCAARYIAIMQALPCSGLMPEPTYLSQLVIGYRTGKSSRTTHRSTLYTVL